LAKYFQNKRPFKLTRQKKASRHGHWAKTPYHTRVCIIKFEIQSNFEKETVLLASSRKVREKNQNSGSTASGIA
jgi:hypothetical protein